MEQNFDPRPKSLETGSRGEVDGQLPAESFELRVLTLADHAAAPADGKLYLAGAGVDFIQMAKIPGPIGALWLVIRFRVPWHRTSEPIDVRIAALDADRKAVDKDPIALARVEVGRPPGIRAGDELAANLILPVGGLRIKREGTIYFHVTVDGQQLGTLPLRVVRREQASLRKAAKS